MNDAGKQAPRVLARTKALREGEWKLVRGRNPELYDIGRDRNERKSLAAEFPDRVRDMKQLHAKILSGR